MAGLLTDDPTAFDSWANVPNSEQPRMTPLEYAQRINEVVRGAGKGLVANTVGFPGDVMELLGINGGRAPTSQQMEQAIGYGSPAERAGGQFLGGPGAPTPFDLGPLVKTGLGAGVLMRGWGGSADVSAKLAQALKETPEIGAIVKNLTPEELSTLTPQRVEAMQEALRGSKSILPNTPPRFSAQDISTMALAGKAKKGWYRNSYQAITDVFGEQDGARFTALLAATSPQLSVEGNLLNAVSIWKNWTQAGRPTDPESIKQIMAASVQGSGSDSVLNAWVNNSIRALSADDPKNILLSGPKVQSFYKNLIGDFDEVTNDTWMGRAFGVVQQLFSGANAKVNGEMLGLKSPGYLVSSAAARDAARKLTSAEKANAKKLGLSSHETWTPAEIQETVWSYVKALYDQAESAGETRTLGQIARQDDLTERIADVPDFATLLSGSALDSSGQPVTTYSNILRQAGYGEQLDALAARGSDFAADTTAEASNRIRGIGKVADGLEQQYRYEKIPLEFNAIRAKAYRSAADSNGAILGGAGAFAGRSTRVVGHNLKTAATEYTLPTAQAERLNRLGVSTPPILELPASADTAKAFHAAISASKEGNPHAAAVYVYSPEEYSQMKLFLTKDRKAGFALKGDDIVSVFNTKGSKHKMFAPYALTLAIQNGGRRLDAFDTVLPHIYSKVGFKTGSRNSWSDEFAPEGWDKALFGRYNNGEPDVVYMYYDPAPIKSGDVQPVGPQQYSAGDRTRARQLFDDYDAAVQAQMEQTPAFKRVAQQNAAAAVTGKTDYQSLMRAVPKGILD
jgi:hypothetical protein